MGEHASVVEKVTFTAVLLLINAQNATLGSPISIAGYGEGCNATLECNKEAHLTCGPSGICSCLMGESMIYEAVENDTSAGGECIVKVGKKCKYAASEETEEDQPASSRYYMCVENAVCGSDGYCSCESGFYGNINGTCSASPGYGENCDSERKCFQELGLECVGGKCDCNGNNSVYHPKLRSCVGLVGRQCVNGTCIDNAGCSGIDHNGNCSCNVGYYPISTVGDVCVPQVGPNEKCSRDDNCRNDSFTDLQMFCIEGRCTCDPEVSTFGKVTRSYRVRKSFSNRKYEYDGYQFDTESLCAPKAKLPCYKGYCAPLSECKFESEDPLENGFNGTCECKTGAKLSKTSKGFCGLPYDSLCSANKPCLENLYCVENLCRCKFNLQSYDVEKEACISHVNGPCKTDDECARRTYCELIPGASTGHCKCPKGYVPTKENGCKGLLDGECQYNHDCYEKTRLQCVNQRCRCWGFANYSVEKRKCLGLVGAMCNETETDSCVSNAVCKKPHSELEAICSCGLGSYETGNYTCQLLNPKKGLHKDDGNADMEYDAILTADDDGLQLKLDTNSLPEKITLMSCLEKFFNSSSNN